MWYEWEKLNEYFHTSHFKWIWHSRSKWSCNPRPVHCSWGKTLIPMLKLSTNPYIWPVKNMSSPLNTCQSHTHHHNLFNVCSNHTKFKQQRTKIQNKQRTRIQNEQFAIYISDTPVNLKQSQGHQTWNDNENPKQVYNRAKFQRSCY